MTRFSLFIVVFLLAGCATQPVASPALPPLPGVVTSHQSDVAARPMVLSDPAASLPVVLPVSAYWPDSPLCYGFFATSPTPNGPWAVTATFPIPPGGGWVCYTNTCTNQMNFIVAGSAAINATPPVTQ